MPLEEPDVDASGDRPPPRADGGKPLVRKGAPRPTTEGKRKRSTESRYVGWGDGIDREVCTRAEHVLPMSFPVASHGGAATIAATVVARRAGALLLCTFSHCGAHVWPDGEVVDDALDDTVSAGS
ncbi:MAG: hypothetical protein K0S78_2158 [Thermomicrobiales bacterium]|nr:hypothetical protein [Thermomicrobiales bacterium]MDF3041073.1 hypothetical protein [Thermomicrobiales bacterium]